MLFILGSLENSFGLPISENSIFCYVLPLRCYEQISIGSRSFFAGG